MGQNFGPGAFCRCELDPLDVMLFQIQVNLGAIVPLRVITSGTSHPMNVTPARSLLGLHAPEAGPTPAASITS
jgi:hypothetical protein